MLVCMSKYNNKHLSTNGSIKGNDDDDDDVDYDDDDD